MSPLRHPPKVRARRPPPHRVIIARGESIRTFTIRPWLIAAAIVVATLVTAGYLGATGYLAFRDDLLQTSIARQSSMQHAYEDKVAALRADIDRLTSRQLLNQQEVEAEMQALLTRQAAIRQRQDMLSGLNDAARAAGIAPPAVAPAAVPSATSPPAAAAATTTAPSAATAKPALKASAILLPSLIGPAEAKESDTPWKPPLAELTEVKADLDRIAQAQAVYVDALTASVVQRSDRLAAVLKGIGRDVPGPKPQPADVGGPYLPLPATAEPALFSASVTRAQSEIDRYTAIRTLALHLPVSTPLADASVTSGFGTRIDPFLGTPALHPGIDYRAPSGQPVAATAPGTVLDVETGYNGGYGNMVDIDHGNGIVTRFAHLSEIAVKTGQPVAKGTVIGRAGSTGRTTGPHLHYEVRVNDEPVDPATFIAAGEKLLPLL